MERFRDPEGRDVDLDLLGDVARLANDRERARDLLEDAALGDAGRTADEDDRDVDDHVLVHPHFEEVRVQHAPVHRVLLVILEEHDLLAAALDLELDHGVELVGRAIAFLRASGSTATFSGLSYGP